MIYLDNAATTYPKPQSVVYAISNAMKKYGANPGRSGHKLSIESALEIYRCRTEISDFFNAEGPEYVVFTLNCTYAINMVLKGLLKEGNHVVISCLEHNAITRPLRALEEKGITFTEAKVYPEDNEATLNSFREAINDRTALIACTCASNVWGIRLPISRIAALAHSYGIPIMVDGAQGAGHIPIDMQESHIDYLCLSGHKGLYGPMGTGVLIATHKENLMTIIEGGTGTNSISYLQPNSMPDKFESGTPNMPGIAGLRAGIKFLKNTGVENIARHEHDLINLLYNKLVNMDHIELYAPKPNAKYFVPVLSFNIKNHDSEIVAAYLDEKGIAVRPGLHCAPSAHKFYNTLDRGVVRICPSYFTKPSEIEALVSALKKFPLR